VSPETTTDKTVAWSSSDTTVASVDNNGLVTAHRVGSATITAKCGGVTATCAITVVITPASGITLDKTESTLKVTETVQLKANVSPETTTDKTVAWSSSDATVASVDNNGLVSAHKVGSATITAKCGDVTATCAITVVTTPASGITLDKTESTLKVTETVQLKATVSPETTTDKTVAWSSSDATVASVDNYGLVTAHKVGSATITAKCGGVTATCTLKIVPTMAERITLSQTTAQLKVGENFTLTATVLPETTTNKTVTWSSSDAAVAVVEANGKITALSLGNSIITARCGDVTANCSVAVVATPAESVTINHASVSLKSGDSVVLTATVLPENATDKTVVWISSNESVATVNADGKVTGIWEGEAAVTAHCGSVSASCSVTVEPTLAESITLNQTALSLKVGESVTLTATVLPESTTNKTVVWTSSNESIATVYPNGEVAAIALGTSVITAKCGEVYTDCIVTVVPTPAESLTLSQTAAQLKVGDSLTLAATVMPEDATDRTVVWTSSDKSVAIVDNNGNVIAVSIGDTEIIAQCGSLTATCSITVSPILVETITLTPATWSGIEGDCIQLVAVVYPENATSKSLNWTSSDEAVATVDSNGLVSIKAEGNCVITVSANDGSDVEAKCIVTGLSGVEWIFDNGDVTTDVYSLGGVLLRKGCDRHQLQQLAPGIYILQNRYKTIKAIVK
ncbi:MAG: Ig-like domain-containing protein, partial [Muribaculaceae bacterium]|nr:Ig-like domain-containing protein [Muribaculaceae bacterium]